MPFAALIPSWSDGSIGNPRYGLEGSPSAYVNDVPNCGPTVAVARSGGSLRKSRIGGMNSRSYAMSYPPRMDVFPRPSGSNANPNLGTMVPGDGGYKCSAVCMVAFASRSLNVLPAPKTISRRSPLISVGDSKFSYRTPRFRVSLRPTFQSSLKNSAHL